MEYLSYITALAKKKGLSIHTDIVRSDLPTITSINKQFYEQWTGGKKYKEEQLDNIKHKDKGGYFFTDDEDPIHIPAELEIIEKALNIAAMELGMHNCKSFVIASDHGASRLAVIKSRKCRMKPTPRVNTLDDAARLSMDAMFLTRLRITDLSFFPIMADSVAAALPM